MRCCESDTLNRREHIEWYFSVAEWHYQHASESVMNIPCLWIRIILTVYNSWRKLCVTSIRKKISFIIVITIYSNRYWWTKHIKQCIYNNFKYNYIFSHCVLSLSPSLSLWMYVLPKYIYTHAVTCWDSANIFILSNHFIFLLLIIYKSHTKTNRHICSHTSK